MTKWEPTMEFRWLIKRGSHFLGCANLHSLQQKWLRITPVEIDKRGTPVPSKTETEWRDVPTEE